MSLLLLLPESAIAHKVELADTVGATLHIEPTDTPRAGEPTTAWFALTRRGGQPIPLADCDCQLAVFSQPSASTDPLLTPPLQPITAEGYQAIPGAELTFPQVGAYELVLSGAPRGAANFAPFELRYDITVAAGRSPAPTPEVRSEVPVPEGTPAATEPEPALFQPIGIGLILMFGAILAAAIFLKVRSKK